MLRGSVVKIAGPLVVADGMSGASVNDAVYVSDERLLGEIIALDGDLASVQMLKQTNGLFIGARVESEAEPLCVELGPGLIGATFDGLRRKIDRAKKWAFEPACKVGDAVSPGDVFGEVSETQKVVHKLMVPPDGGGTVSWVAPAGTRTADELTIRIKTIRGDEIGISMISKWPIRKPRPYGERRACDGVFETGQRVIDTFFPLARGGAAALPGGFGTGKTALLHSIANGCDADVIVYIGLGMRGSEVRGALPVEKTVQILSTADMPIVSREAAVYSGIAIAEYYRDMGYHVAVMADSTTRWAEALREVSIRRSETPGDEGYPAYLPSRIAAFYERAGRVSCLGSGEREGTISIIGAISPPGGDLAEPVTRATLRVVKALWALSGSLASRSHFPAVDYLSSYSLYSGAAVPRREEALAILKQDARGDDPRLSEAACALREDFLMQHAAMPLKEQAEMLLRIMDAFEKDKKSLAEGGALDD